MTDNKIDVVIAPSQFVLDLHKKYGFFKNTKTVVLPHGIDLNTADAQKYCENIAKKDSNFHILYVGGLLRQKGVHVLINAFMQIKDANLKLHVVGGGANEDALRRLAQKDERITFHGRHPAHEVQKFYPLADITVVPSLWYDVRPGVIVESFKFGVPVIASNIGGIPELVKNGHNGYLCEPGNEKQLASILKQCIQDAQYIKKLGANAKEFVKQFEMSLYTKKLLTIYSEAIALNKSRY